MSGRDADDAEELLRRWQVDGDRQALDQLLGLEIASLKERLHRRGMPGSPPGITASDIAQDVAIRVLQVEPAPSFETPSAMRGYLWIAAQRLLVEHLRKRHSAALPLDASNTGNLDRALQSTGGMGGVEDRDRSIALGLALELLEPEERELLEQHYFRELDPSALAESLGVSADAARMRVARARGNLARKLVRWTGLVT